MNLSTLFNSSLAANDIAYNKQQELKISFKELTKNADKHKWNSLFNRGYSEKVRNANAYELSQNAIFLLAYDGNKELGYLRMTRHTEFAAYGASENIYCVSEAYVKHAYRNNGVLREMLKHVIKNYNVKMIYLDVERAEMYRGYYASLGFTVGVLTQYINLVYLCQTNFEPYIAAHHNALKNVKDELALAA